MNIEALLLMPLQAFQDRLNAFVVSDIRCRVNHDIRIPSLVFQDLEAIEVPDDGRD